MNHIITFLLIFISTTIFAQKDTATPEHFAFAKEMSEKYEDESLAVLSSLTDIIFDFDKDTKLVTSTVKTIEQLISLKPDVKLPIVEFYDDYSEVNSVLVENIKGKKVPISMTKEIYSQEGIFYSDAKICYSYLTYPTIGTYYKVETEKKYKDIRYFISEYLTTIYPQKNKVVRFHIPSWLYADFKEMNFEGFDIKREEKKNTKLDVTTISYSIQNAIPQTSESYGKGPSHLYPHLLFLNQGHNYNGNYSKGFQETKDLYSWYKTLTSGMNNVREEVAEQAKKLTENVETEEAKIKAIYYWVQENIRYIAFEDGIAGFQPEDCQEVYNNKYGDCKGMANLTKEMLKSIGLDARLTWIGTRRLAYDYSTPSLGVDNHMICAVKHKGDFYFLDATEEFNELGEYAERIQGREVMIENGDDYILDTIPVRNYSGNTKFLSRQLKLDDDRMIGKSKYEMEGDSKSYFLYQVSNMEQDKREEAMKSYLTDKDKSFKVENVVTSDLEKRDGIIEIDYDFEWNKGVSSFGEETYLDIDFEKEFKNWTFDEDRKTDYLFSHKLHYITETEVELPTSHHVTYLPESFEREHDDFFFKINYSEKDGKIIYRKELGIPNSEIKKEDFETWNTFVKDLTKQYKEQIVLSKKS